MSLIPKTDKSQLSQESERTPDRRAEIQNARENGKEPLNEAEKKEYEEHLRIEKELDAEIQKMKADLAAGPSEEETMELLHDYNNIKDATQHVLGAMADMQRVTVASLHKAYNLPLSED